MYYYYSFHSVSNINVEKQNHAMQAQQFVMHPVDNTGLSETLGLLKRGAHTRGDRCKCN